MKPEEKAIARQLFKNRIYKSDGQAFENLFTEVMNYYDAGFQQIKPWGNIGDRKNDGYIKSKGIYYQVYAPEDIRSKYPESIRKLKVDFSGLLEHWAPVNEFYYVVNDKYDGVNADAERALNDLIKTHGLKAGRIITPKDLERIALALDDDQILSITGFLPNVESITHLDFSAMNEVVGHISRLPTKSPSGEIKLPDWEEKIQFNGLSPAVKFRLDFGSQQLGALEEYLSNENFLAEELQNKLNGLYVELKLNRPRIADPYPGDYIFWELVKKSSPRNETAYEAAVMTILSKYFESCDIFEEPTKD
jgi:hypothetical protein